MTRLRRHLSFANVASLVALTLSLGFGGAYAAQNLIGTGDIEKNAITSKLIDNSQVKSKDIKDNKGVKGADVKDSTLTGIDILDGSLNGADVTDDSLGAADIGAGEVGSSEIADGGVAQADLSAAEAFRTIGAAGQPTFVGGDGCSWSNYLLTGARLNPAAFFKDLSGVVHLSGVVQASDNAGTGDGICDGEAAERTIFVLPAGYVPENDEISVFPTDLVSPEPGPTSLVLLIIGREGLVAPGLNLPPGTLFLKSKPDDGDLVFLDGVTFRSATPDNGLARSQASGGDFEADTKSLGG